MLSFSEGDSPEELFVWLFCPGTATRGQGRQKHAEKKMCWVLGDPNNQRAKIPPSSMYRETAGPPACSNNPKAVENLKKKSELEQNKSVVGLIKNKLSIVSTMPIKSLPQQHPYKVLFPTVTSAVLNSYGKTTGSKPVTSKTLNMCCFFSFKSDCSSLKGTFVFEINALIFISCLLSIYSKRHLTYLCCLRSLYFQQHIYKSHSHFLWIVMKAVFNCWQELLQQWMT